MSTDAQCGYKEAHRGIDGVHGRKVIKVGEVHGALGHEAHGRAGGLEHVLEVDERLRLCT